MFAYLSVANGSDEPPKFVELTYKGSSDDASPFALVGKVKVAEFPKLALKHGILFNLPI